MSKSAKIAPAWSTKQNRTAIVESDDEKSVDSEEEEAKSKEVTKVEPSAKDKRQSELHELAVQHAQYRAEVRDRVMKVVMSEVMPDIGSYDVNATVVSKKSKYTGPFWGPFKMIFKFLGCWPLNLHESILTGNVSRIENKCKQIMKICEKMNLDPKHEINCYDDVYKQTPLSLAVKTKRSDFVEIILSQGGIPDFPDMETGRTPLMFSVLNGTHLISQSLIRNGASVNMCDNKCVTPLMLAAVNNDARHCKMLCDKLADFDSQDENGMSPLHFAAYGNGHEAAAYLVKEGARRDLKDSNKRKAIHLARFMNHGLTVAVLEDMKTRIAEAEGRD
jgi:hypothetical protein